MRIIQPPYQAQITPLSPAAPNLWRCVIEQENSGEVMILHETARKEDARTMALLELARLELARLDHARLDHDHALDHVRLDHTSLDPATVQTRRASRGD